MIWEHKRFPETTYPFQLCQPNKPIHYGDGSPLGTALTRSAENSCSNSVPVCAFCSSEMHSLIDNDFDFSGLISNLWMSYTQVNVCNVCGWWAAHRWSRKIEKGRMYSDLYYGAPVMTELCTEDISVPLDEVRKYLCAKEEARFSVNPTVMEQVVGSVFGDHGYDVRVVGKSNDKGIDAILDRAGKTIGVQIKRYKNKIGAEQLREFVGALVGKGITKGLHVTTSDYTAGAREVARNPSAIKTISLAVELMNWDEFSSCLKLAQRSRYRDASDFNMDYIGGGLVNRIPHVFREEADAWEGIERSWHFLPKTRKR